MRRTFAVVAVALAGTLGLVACDDDADQSAAEAQLCTDLEAFRTALSGLEGVQLEQGANTANVTVGRVKATWSGVQEAARDISEADAEAVGTALDDLEQTAGDLPAEATPAQVRAELEPQVSEVQEAFAEMRDGIQCS